MNLAHLFKKPIITEKTLEATKLNRYTFEVDVRATKNQIKAAAAQQFKVDVVKVMTSVNKGIIKRTGRRRLPTQKPDIKKAVIEIKKGQTIKVFETQG